MRLPSWISAAAIVLGLLAPASALGAADVSISVTASPGAIPLGGPETVDVAVTATNEGPDPATSVQGAVAYSNDELSFTGFKSITQGGAAQVPANDPPIAFNFGEIQGGKAATLVFVLNDVRSGPGVVWTNATTSTPEASTKNNAGTTTVDVTALVPSAPLLQFGVHALGGAGAAQVLTLTNHAAVPVAVGSALSSGEGFSIADKDCAGNTLAVGQSCELSVGFKPTASGARDGVATIVSSTAKVMPLEVPLTGIGEIARDVQPASLTLTGLPKSVTAEKFRKGFSVTITPSEAVALDVELRGKARKGALASAFELSLFERSLGLAAGAQTVKVKPTGRLLGGMRTKFKAQLRVEATDAAGNPSSLVRTIKVKPAKRSR